MALSRLRSIRSLYKTTDIGQVSSLLGISRSSPNYSPKDPGCWSCVTYFCGEHAIRPLYFSEGISSCAYSECDESPWTSRSILRLRIAAEPSNFGCIRLLSTQAKAPAQAQKMGALKVSMVSPGIVHEPYAPREKIPFWKRCFTRTGWRRTKEDIMLELRSAYAINRLRKTGYSKKKFYGEAANLYREISTLMAHGDKTSLRKLVTEKMYSALKNEIKQRESKWSSMYWELLTPIVSIRTLRARVIGVDRDDSNKVFVQLTLEFLTKQKFEAYDSNGAVAAGDKNKEVLVRDIWVFEKSMFHPGACWRLCGRINIQ